MVLKENGKDDTSQKSEGFGSTTLGGGAQAYADCTTRGKGMGGELGIRLSTSEGSAKGGGPILVRKGAGPFM